jgi:hypothetical protein
MVDRLGNALVEALANDEQSRALVQEIQAHGFEMALLLEATVALRRREDADLDTEPDGIEDPQDLVNESGEPWSEEDKAFLRTFKISL